MRFAIATDVSVDAQTVLHDVELLREGGLAFLCRVDRREVWIPRAQLLSGTTIARAGDRGIVVVPTWLASDLGLAIRR